MSLDEFEGLVSVLYLVNGTKVRLTKNIWIEKDLWTEPPGILTQMAYKDEDKWINFLFLVDVFLKFDQYVSPAQYLEESLVMYQQGRSY